MSNGAYAQAHHESVTDPAAFWGKAAEVIDWITPPTQILDDSNPPFYRWFADGTLNTCYNAIDRHVANGRADQAAVIYDSPMTDTARTITYAELLEQVSKFAGVLRSLGVEKGDRVVIYMPMIPEALIAMYACARLGAIHSVVFGGFAPAELAARIEDASPKIIIAASCGIEPNRVIPYKPFLDAAIERSSHKPDHRIIFQREQAVAELGELDIDWVEAMSRGIEPTECVEVKATDPLYILYTSGTTGKPKGIVRDNGGHAVAMAWSLHALYGTEAGEVFWAASDVGWVVGHSYIVYSPLLAGATTIMYEGKPVGTPDAGAFWRVIEKYKVAAMFTAPTAFRAIKKEDPEATLLAQYDISSMRRLFLAGERLDPDTYHWATNIVKVPVIDNWWQTETGWPIATNPVGIEELPIKAGSPSVAGPGYDVHVLDEQGNQLPANAEGSISIKLPMPPGTLPTLWQDDDRYVSSYLKAYDGYYLTGDGGYIDEDGYIYVMGRTDDVLNIAGHRLSTGSIESALSSHPQVAECAVIGVADEMKGQIPRALVVVKSGVDTSDPAVVDRLKAELVQLVRAEVGAVAALKVVDVVVGLPKTRSGKMLRKTMRQIADGQEALVPSTIEDVSVLDRLRPILRPGQGTVQ